jgi:hypothetical protein
MHFMSMVEAVTNMCIAGVAGLQTTVEEDGVVVQKGARLLVARQAQSGVDVSQAVLR